MADIDKRTKAYQSADRLLVALVSDLGGDELVSAGERELAQRAAVLGAMTAHLEAQWLRGDPIDLESYLSAVNSHRRVLATLGFERRQKDVTDTLAYAAEKARAA